MAYLVLSRMRATIYCGRERFCSVDLPGGKGQEGLLNFSKAPISGRLSPDKPRREGSGKTTRSPSAGERGDLWRETTGKETAGEAVAESCRSPGEEASPQQGSAPGRTGDEIMGTRRGGEGKGHPLRFPKRGRGEEQEGGRTSSSSPLPKSRLVASSWGVVILCSEPVGQGRRSDKENDIDENDRNRIVGWTESHGVSPFGVREVSLDGFSHAAST